MSNYKVDFMDSIGDPPTPVYYGTADINNIRKSLMTKGVLMESETSCKVVAGTTGKVVISAGQAIMADGSRIEILTGGEELDIIDGGKNYVFFHRDTSLNTIIPKISLTAPIPDDVALAEILDSVITYENVREKSYAKTAFTPPPCLWFDFSASNISLPPNTWILLGTLDVPNGYNKLIIRNNESTEQIVFFDVYNQKSSSIQNGKACFLYSSSSSNKQYINVSADKTVWELNTYSSTVISSPVLRGFAYYGGVV